MQQILHQPKGAQQAADHPAQYDPEQHQQAQHIEGELMLQAAQRRLEGANRAGPQCAGAGVAVQDGDADGLCAAGENPSPLKADQIPVHQDSGDELYRPLEGNAPLYPIPMHSRHIFTAFCMTARCSRWKRPVAIRATATASRLYRTNRMDLLRKADLRLSAGFQGLVY